MSEITDPELKRISERLPENLPKGVSLQDWKAACQLWQWEFDGRDSLIRLIAQSIAQARAEGRHDGILCNQSVIMNLKELAEGHVAIVFLEMAVQRIRDLKE